MGQPKRRIHPTAEEAWDMRVAVHRAASQNPAYRAERLGERTVNPRLEGMDSLDSVAFIIDLEEQTGLSIPDEVAQAFLGGNKPWSGDQATNVGYQGSLNTRELGRIANYLLDIKYGVQ